MDLDKQAWDLAEINLLKIEAPTRQEIEDRERDGHPTPAWVLKDRHPTHAIAYFETIEELRGYLVNHFGELHVDC